MTGCGADRLHTPKARTRLEHAFCVRHCFLAYLAKPIKKHGFSRTARKHVVVSRGWRTMSIYVLHVPCESNTSRFISQFR